MTGLPTSSNTLKNIYCVFIFKLFSYYTIFHLDFIAILHTAFSIFYKCINWSNIPVFITENFDDKIKLCYTSYTNHTNHT